MTAINLCRQTISGLLDLVYPPRCLICDAYDSAVVCPRCEASFSPIPEPVCAACGHPQMEAREPCRHCVEIETRGGWGFDAARASGVYQGALRQGIHRLKYNRRERLGPALGAYLANRCVVDGLLDAEWLTTVDAVIPLPLHPARIRTRGFNQAALLALPLAEMQGVPLWENVIRRTGSRTPQVGLSGDARRRNIAASAFVVSDSALVAGKTLLLVDDVRTTGTTVSECARALKAAGATKVYVVTLAAGG